MWNQISFGVVLVIVAAGLFWHQRLANQQWDVAAGSLPESLRRDERQFLQVRRRRRLLTSVMIGLVGIVIAFGVLIRSERIALYFWCSILFLTLNIIILGLVDHMGTRRHLHAVFAAQRRVTDQMRRELEAEVAALREKSTSPPASPPSST